MQKHLYLLLILLAYFIAGGLYAIYTPDWQAPDEPAHYNYVRQLAAGRLPVIEPGDYDQAYKDEVVGSGFAPHYSIEPFKYEDWQPPLYYLLQTPVYRLFDGALRPMRLFSVLLGAGVVILAYAVALEVFSGRPWLALTAAAFVALLPQHVAMMAAVNNDSLAEVLIGGILLALVSWIAGEQACPERSRRGSRPALSEAKGGAGEQGSKGAQKLGVGNWRLIVLGVLLGLGLMTKATVYLMAPVVGLTLLWRYWGDWASLWRLLMLVFVPAVLLGALWWGRNLVVYDGFDPLAIAAHERVVVGQPRTAGWIAEHGIGYTLRAFFRTTFQSFWGQFGWMGVPMPAWVYRWLLAFTGLTVLGLLVAAGRAVTQPRFRLRPAWFILAGVFDLTLLLYLFYNLTYVQHQGRYLFPALIPISIGVALGLGALWRPIGRFWPPLRYLLPLGLATGLFGLDLLALFHFILPQLAR